LSSVVTVLRIYKIPVKDDIVAEKLSQELKWKIIRFLADYAHATKASRKRERYKIEPRI